MKLLTANEVANILRVSTARVYELARTKAIPSITLGERQIRFEYEALIASLRRGHFTDHKAATRRRLKLMSNQSQTSTIDFEKLSDFLSAFFPDPHETLVWLKGGGWKFGEPKTARSRRTVSFAIQMARALLIHKREQNEARLKAGPQYQNNDLVFTASDDKPHNLRNLTQRHFRPILRRSGLPTVRLYDLRHTCATLLLAAGEHAKIVSERLGHASITLTLDTYSHVRPTMQQSATEKLEKLLYG